MLFGFVLMFVCTWPIDLWAAAGSHGLVSVTIPPFLPILVGYGFVVAAVVMTAVLDGRAGVVTLLRRFLIWRFGVLWYAVILLGPIAVDLASIGVDVLLHGTVPAFDQPFILRIVGPSIGLALALPLFIAMERADQRRGDRLAGVRAAPAAGPPQRARMPASSSGSCGRSGTYPKFLNAGNSAHDYPFWLFLLDIVAKSIIFTWVFNSTGGSLLSVTLLHASMNTSVLFLPVLPAVTGDTTVLVTEDRPAHRDRHRGRRHRRTGPPDPFAAPAPGVAVGITLRSSLLVRPSVGGAMTRAEISIRQSRPDQDDLRGHREHASVRPDFAAALGLDVGRQAIIRRDDGRFALYTLTDARAGVRRRHGPHGRGGRGRLGGAEEEQFGGRLDSVAVDPAATVEEAQRGEKLLELLDDEGSPTACSSSPRTAVTSSRSPTTRPSTSGTCWPTSA